ncbi:MAG TPA: 4-hydroxy-tetrahydrodipicolinate synthase [Firmicutes bacterium]|nr:4-hydroxy-tetrahydrodipicolinate synthase [Bacillota bacterium]
MGAVITAMVTPFDQEGKVDYQTAVELARYLSKNGSDAVILSGTTGESPTLTREEKLELFRQVVKEVGHEIKVIAGTGSNSTAAAIELTSEAAKAGADGILLVTPYYNKPTQEGLYKHFKLIASATDLPVILYNVPGRTGVNMTAATTLRLAEIDNIVAVKEASGDVEQAAAICRQAPEGFCLYSGDDSMTLPMLSVGASGVMSVASHLVGREIAGMINHYKEGRRLQAQQIHHRLLPLFKGLFIVSNPIPIKAALNLIGIKVGEPRLPLLPLEEKLKLDLQQILKELRLV